MWRKIKSFFERRFFKPLTFDPTFWNSKEGKISRLEYTIAAGENIRAEITKIVKDPAYPIIYGREKTDILKGYLEWVKNTTDELGLIFDTPRNAAKFNSYSAEEDRGYSLSRELNEFVVKKEIDGKLKILEETLKELKSIKESKKERLIENKLFIALAPTVFLILLKIIIYLLKGYSFGEIPFP